MAQAGCTVAAQVTQHDPDRHNTVVHAFRTPVAAGQTLLKAEESRWKIGALMLPVAGQAGALDCVMTFRCVSGSVTNASLSAQLELDRWSGKNYVLLPAAAYNGNRFLARKIPYSPKLYYVQDIGPDKPVIITDVPRLNIGEGVSRIQDRVSSLSVPSIGFQDPERELGFLLLTRQGNDRGDYGIGIEENRDRSRAVISLTSPLVRELHSYRICNAEHPSTDRPADFKAGDSVTMSFRLHVFTAPKVQDLFDQFSRVRKALYPPVAPKPVLPYSACMAQQEEKFNRDNFVPKYGYYSVGPRQNFLQDWQIGWTGGMISTYPLLFAGGAKTRKNVLRNFDWLFPDGIAPSGFFWDSGCKGTEWIGGDIRKPQSAHWHLIRKSGDAVFFILKQFDLMAKLGIAVKPAWRKGVKRVCDALVKLWEKNRQFGQFVHSLTGEICVGGSTSGAVIPAALVLAAEYFKQPRYLRVAGEAAEKYYDEFVVRGLSCGGPGDALQNPDSESWYALVESFVALHESTGRKLWLQRAAETSRQFSSWVVAYDYQFPPQSTFGRAGIRSTGSVYANTQNKHSAPGLCTLSGLGFFKLFRATGDRFHLDLLRDIAFGLPQYLPHPLKPIDKAKPGWMCERVNLTDWEGPEMIGETHHMMTWAETTLMLTTIEIPGLYVQPDQSLVVAFDNIAAEVLADDSAELVVQLKNPTPAPAQVKIFSETSREARAVLPENYLYDCPMAELKPGESRTLRFKK